MRILGIMTHQLVLLLLITGATQTETARALEEAPAITAVHHQVFSTDSPPVYRRAHPAEARADFVGWWLLSDGSCK